jgi:hypothetical protein
LRIIELKEISKVIGCSGYINEMTRSLRHSVNSTWQSIEEENIKITITFDGTLSIPFGSLDIIIKIGSTIRYLFYYPGGIPHNYTIVRNILDHN